MSKAKTGHHVDDFMMSIEPDFGLAQVGDLIAQASKRRKGPAAGLEKLRSWISGSIVDDHTLETFERLRGAGIDGDALGASPGVTEFIAVGHARARHILEASPGLFTYEEVSRRLGRADEIIAAVEDDFIGEVLIRTATRDRYDAAFHARLREETRRVVSAASAVDRLSDAIAHDRDDDGDNDGGEIIPFAKARCTINGRPASCKLVVILIIIIVIVSKVAQKNEPD